MIKIIKYIGLYLFSVGCVVFAPILELFGINVQVAVYGND